MKKADSINRQNYLSPIVTKIEIDKDISLQLASSPPIGPSETNNNIQPNQMNPYKNDLV
jgi:hypothetical protein